MVVTRGGLGEVAGFVVAVAILFRVVTVQKYVHVQVTKMELSEGGEMQMCKDTTLDADEIQQEGVQSWKYDNDWGGVQDALLIGKAMQVKVFEIRTASKEAEQLWGTDVVGRGLCDVERCEVKWVDKV